MKILLIQQKMIGDVLLSSILLEVLKRKYPKAEIHYLVNSNTIPVIAQNPFVDKIVEYKSIYDTDKLAFVSFIKHIRNAKYTKVFDAYGVFSSNVISLFSGAAERISFKKKFTNFIYTKTVERKAMVLTNAGNALENRLRLLLPEAEIAQNIVKPRIFLTNKELKEARAYLTEMAIDFSKPLVMISVLGSSADKSYPHEYMVNLLNAITAAHPNLQLLFNYLPSQKNEAKAIYNLTSDLSQKNIFFDVFGSNLRHFLAILAQCNALVGNEGGAVNMAKALSIPTFTIFSPWVKKNVWNMFEDGTANVSVHLADFKPKMYADIEYYKTLKPKATAYYKAFSPKFIAPKLLSYLEENITN